MTTWLDLADSLSMLRRDALQALSKFAAESQGPILELGPYVGGSSIALLAGGTSDVISIEIGGANKEHEIATDDIHASYIRNIETVGYLDRATLVAGHFRAETVAQQVEQKLNGRKAGLLFIDVNPGTEIALALYARYCQPGAFLVIDDYYSNHAVAKADRLSRYIHDATAIGAIESSDVLGWGTWFGRFATLDQHMIVERLIDCRIPVPTVAETGFCHVCFVGSGKFADDATNNQSPLLLRCDDQALPHPHATHQAIRDSGGGRYSHWRDDLWFSMPDNSDPADADGRLSVRIHNSDFALNEPVFL